MGRPAADVGPLDEARERLVEEHLDLVDFCVKFSVRRYPGLTHDEARSVGLLALVEAAARYDEGRGDFAPYAKTWIKGAIKKAVSTLHPDRVAAQSGHTLEQVLAGEHLGTQTPRGRDPASTIGAPLDLDRIIDPITTLRSRMIRAERHAAARDVLEQFDPDTQALITAVYIDETPLRAFARAVGKSHTTLLRRLDDVKPVFNARLHARLARR